MARGAAWDVTLYVLGGVWTACWRGRPSRGIQKKTAIRIRKLILIHQVDSCKLKWKVTGSCFDMRALTAALRVHYLFIQPAVITRGPLLSCLTE